MINEVKQRWKTERNRGIFSKYKGKFFELVNFVGVHAEKKQTCDTFIGI